MIAVFLREWVMEPDLSPDLQVGAEAVLVLAEGFLPRDTSPADLEQLADGLRRELSTAITPETLPLVQRFLAGEIAPNTDYHLARSEALIRWIQRG